MVVVVYVEVEVCGSCICGSGGVYMKTTWTL